MKLKLDTADVVVVGAGIAGMTTAYELKARGYDVVVVEQRFLAYGASGRSAGAIWLQTCSAGTELELARAGRDLYQRYISEIGNTFDYRQNGGLFFFESEEQGAVLEKYAEDRREAGLDIQMLSKSEMSERTSLVPETAIGAVFCADDAQVDAGGFVEAVAGACARKGVRLYEHTTVVSVIRKGDAITGVRTPRGDIDAPAIVWATGAWAVNLSSEGIELPLTTARQGQILSQKLKPEPMPLLRGPRGVMWARALTSLPDYDPEAFAPTPSNARVSDGLQYDDVIAQNSEGAVFLGSSIDEIGALNPHIGMAATNAMLANSLDRYPQHAGLGVVGLWAGITSWTQDQVPIVDQLDGHYLNVGHARGIATAPIASETVAARIASESHTFHESMSLARALAH